jgi:spoIIIJ-associated protein
MSLLPSVAAQLAKRVTGDILERMGLTVEISVREDEDAIRLTLQAQESGLLIGKQGANLNALQLLVGLIVNGGGRGRARSLDEAGEHSKIKVILDTEGYRNRRQASLEAMAHRMAEKALATGKIMEIHTMSSYERRIIHLTLAPLRTVTTRSEGVGPQRRLLVIPQGVTAVGEASSRTFEDDR